MKACLRLARVALTGLAGALTYSSVSVGATACADLALLPLAGTTITAAHEVTGGSFTPPGSGNPITNLPDFCRVALTVAPEIGVLMAVQRFPEEYDGLVIAAPAIHWERFIAAEIWPQIVMHQALGAPIDPARLAGLNAEAVAACDMADGVKDDVINDPRKCEFDPSSSAVLTPAEAAVVRKIWNGPTGAKTGKRLWFGLEPGTSFAGLANPSPFSIATTHLAYWVNQNPSFDWKSITEAGFEAQFRQSFRKFNDVIGTDEDNLQAFRKRGGKIVMWHGESDQLIFPRGTVNYYERVASGNGGLKHVDDFMRLFMAPGVAHCAGGAGPQPVGTLEAVVDWVENGVAPDTILATRNLGGGAVRTRPLCAYPETAVWTGSGSTDDAASFACVDGQHDKNDFKITGFGSN